MIPLKMLLDSKQNNNFVKFYGILQTVTTWRTGTRLFDLADSVRPIGSGRFCQAISVWAVSITGHFGHDISAHKQLNTFVYYMNI